MEALGYSAVIGAILGVIIAIATLGERVDCRAVDSYSKPEVIKYCARRAEGK